MRRINLVPPPPLAFRIKRIGLPVAVFLVAVVVFWIAVSATVMKRDLALLMVKRARLQQRLAQRQALLAKAAALKKEVDGLRERQRKMGQEVAALMESRRLIPPYSNLMLLLSRLMPASAKVDQISLKGGMGRISGVITRMGEMSPLVEELAKSPIIDEARLITLEVVDKGHHLYRFTIEVKLRQV